MPIFPEQTVSNLRQRTCPTLSNQYPTSPLFIQCLHSAWHHARCSCGLSCLLFTPSCLSLRFILICWVPTSQNSETVKNDNVCNDISTALGTEQRHSKYQLSLSLFYRSGNWGKERWSCGGSVNGKVRLQRHLASGANMLSSSQPSTWHTTTGWAQSMAARCWAGSRTKESCMRRGNWEARSRWCGPLTSLQWQWLYPLPGQCWGLSARIYIRS